MCQMFESFHEQQSKSLFFVYNFTLLKFQCHITRIIKIFSQKIWGVFWLSFFLRVSISFWIYLFTLCKSAPCFYRGNSAWVYMYIFWRISVWADADYQSWWGPDHPIQDSGPLRSHHHVGGCPTSSCHMSGSSWWVRPLQLTWGPTITRQSQGITYLYVTITVHREIFAHVLLSLLSPSSVGKF